MYAAKSLQSCLTLCDPIDSSPPGSPVPGILQARTLEWAAISFSNAWKWKVKVKLLSRALLLATPWTAAYQAPLSMGFSRQEYWSGVPLPSPVFLLVFFKLILYTLLHKSLTIYLARFVEKYFTFLKTHFQCTYPNSCFISPYNFSGKLLIRKVANTIIFFLIW